MSRQKCNDRLHLLDRSGRVKLIFSKQGGFLKSNKKELQLFKQQSFQEQTLT